MSDWLVEYEGGIPVRMRWAGGAATPHDERGELQRLFEQHPDVQRQVAEFGRIIDSLPCAICEDADHTAREGHSPKGASDIP